MDMGDEFGPLAYQANAATHQIPGVAQRFGIDIGYGRHATAQQGGDLMGIDRIVFCLAAVNGFHVHGMTEDEGNVLVFAPIGDSIRRKHTVDADDDVTAIGFGGIFVCRG